tara:strand:- start:978 stop:1634 length:657 start_codon:yes stop_codon:yes gene_type:complete
MIRKEDAYKQAIEFRKRGFTYSEIAKICGVSKGTVFNWLSKKKFSRQVAKDNAVRAAKENVKRIGLVNKARVIERKTRYSEAEKAAVTEFKHYKHNMLFITALSFYRASGDLQDSSRIRLSSNDVEQHRVFVKFLVEFLGVEKEQVQFWLLLHAKQPEERIVKYWSRRIPLSVARFGKTQRTKQTAEGLHYGTGNTIIGNTVLKKKILKWIELALKET